MFLDVLGGAERFWGEFTSWTPPDLVMFAIVLLSIASAVLVTRMTSAPQLVSVPASFFVLMFFGILANFLGRPLLFEGVSEFQKALLLTAAGHCVAALVLLGFFKVGEVRR